METLFNMIVLGCAVLSAIMLLCLWYWRTKNHILSWLSLIILCVVGMVGIAAFWYTHRPLPTHERRIIFEGVEYIREIHNTPVANVIHVIRIDLDAEGIEFFVSPHDAITGFDLAARTPSQFLSEFGLQVVINGDFFDPWHEYGIFNYYPHVGDGVNTRGLSILRGEVQTVGYSQNFQTFNITQDNQAFIGEPTAQTYTAISGYIQILQDGVPTNTINDAYTNGRHPRTAIAVDEANETIIFIVVDGRQPNYSDGVTLDELSEIALQYGGYHALNLDGGGSSTLVIEGEHEQPLLLNSPIHGLIPYTERPSANQFGIYADPNRLSD